MEIVDDFLEEDVFLELQRTIISKNFPVFFQDSMDINYNTELSAYAGDIKSLNFTHMLYDEYDGVVSRFYEWIVEKLFSRYNMKEIIRAKVNCYPRTSRIVSHHFHSDYSHPHKGAILSLNTCNGLTKFKRGPGVKSIANRVLFFDPSVVHASTSCTDQKCRWNIICNYL